VVLSLRTGMEGGENMCMIIIVPKETGRTYHDGVQ